MANQVLNVAPKIVETLIHPTAIIDPSARIGKNVHIGSYSVIGPDVEIDNDTWIGPHVVIQGPTSIGHGNQIFQFASVGEMPQDLKYRGEKTSLHIGDRNIIREFCTINRGTIQDQSATRIGHDNLFMAYVHIAHDCQIGNGTIFANNASLAGHVVVEDHAILSGFSGVYQFCRIGAYSFAATNSVIIKDVPPFVKVSGYYAKPFGLNIIGLTRHEFPLKTIRALKNAYKIIYRQGLTLNQAIETLQNTDCAEVAQMIGFITNARGGIVR